MYCDISKNRIFSDVIELFSPSCSLLNSDVMIVKGAYAWDCWRSYAVLGAELNVATLVYIADY